MTGAATLLTALAQHLDNTGVATYRTGTPYTAAETAVFIGTQGETPDRAVTLAAYPLAGDLTGAGPIGVQVKVRGKAGDTFDAVTLLDQVVENLHGINGATINGVRIASLTMTSGTTPYVDANSRTYMTVNFVALTARATKHTRA